MLGRKWRTDCCLTGTEKVIDVYSGIETISLFLAQKAEKVYGVEIIPQSHRGRHRKCPAKRYWKCGICHFRDTPKIYNAYIGQRKSLRDFYRSVKNRRRKAKYPASFLVELHDKLGNSIAARIVFMRDHQNKSKWLALYFGDIMEIVNDSLFVNY